MEEKYVKYLKKMYFHMGQEPYHIDLYKNGRVKSKIVGYLLDYGYLQYCSYQHDYVKLTIRAINLIEPPNNVMKPKHTKVDFSNYTSSSNSSKIEELEMEIARCERAIRDPYNESKWVEKESIDRCKEELKKYS